MFARLLLAVVLVVILVMFGLTIIDHSYTGHRAKYKWTLEREK